TTVGGGGRSAPAGVTVVEEGALRPSRNLVGRGWDRTGARRAAGGPARGCGFRDACCASSSTTVGGGGRSAPAGVTVVEEGALCPYRNLVGRGWDRTGAGGAAGWFPARGCGFRDACCASSSTTVGGGGRSAPAGVTVVEEGALRPSRNLVGRGWGRARGGRGGGLGPVRLLRGL